MCDYLEHIWVYELLYIRGFSAADLHWSESIEFLRYPYIVLTELDVKFLRECLPVNVPYIHCSTKVVSLAQYRYHMLGNFHGRTLFANAPLQYINEVICGLYTSAV